MRRFLDLHFSMPCPYVYSDTEQECGTTIRVRAWPGSPRTSEYPGDDPAWEAWGCHHVEGKTVDERVAYKIDQRIKEEESDAQARAAEARIARAEESG